MEIHPVKSNFIRVQGSSGGPRLFIRELPDKDGFKITVGRTIISIGEESKVSLYSFDDEDPGSA